MSRKEEIIKRAVLKSGFPLQMEISGVLRKRDYDVYNGVYFFDPDEKKAREFDIEAFMSTERIKSDKLIEEDKWYFNPSILIECKKSEKYSWVFFDSEPISGWMDIGHSIDIFTVKNGYINSACGRLLTKEPLEHYIESEFTASAFQQVRSDRKNQSGKNEILDAISKIIKFMNYEFENLKKFFAKDSTRKDIIFSFPIAVFSGELYFATFKDELEIRSISHLVYETKYLSNLTGALVPLYIDIVKKDALNELLATIEKEVCNITKRLEKSEVQKELNSII